MNDIQTRLQARNGDFPPSWFPQPGEALIGELLYFTTAQATHGEVRIAVIREQGTEQAYS